MSRWSLCWLCVCAAAYNASVGATSSSQTTSTTSSHTTTSTTTTTELSLTTTTETATTTSQTSSQTSQTSQTTSQTTATSTSQTVTTATSTRSTSTATLPETCDTLLSSALLSLGVAPEKAGSLACAPCDPSAALSISCDPDGHVVSISLQGQGLQGHLPPALAELSYLRRLKLGFNRISGPIPPDLGRLQDLELLLLTSNELTGPIPRELGNLSKMQALYCASNKLSGSLPRELGSLSSLQDLDLSDNQLTGPLPMELGSLATVKNILLGFNRFQGDLPSSFGSLRSLTDLLLHNNQLSGELPKELRGLRRLRRLELFSNNFTKEIPAELGQLRSLRILHLSRNQFVGPLPKELGKLSRLQQLDLSHNLLSGTIPSEIAQLRAIKEINLRNNLLEGGMPMADFQALGKLDLSQNLLTGSVLLGSLRRIKQLSLRGNLLSGTIPPEIGGLLPLRVLDLGENSFSGQLPPLGNLTRLQELQMDGNGFSGELSEDLCQLRFIQHFSCSRNQLTGRIPDCLWKLPRLHSLLLHDNGFTGPLPPVLWAQNLVALTLHNNALIGSLPSRLSRLKDLAVLTLHGNRLSGSVQDLSLTAPCLDNPHFELQGRACRDWADEPVESCETLVSYALAREELAELVRNCPRSCQKCDQQLEEPKVTLHRNTFSCSVPEHVTSGNVLATVVMGNMIGDGHALPSWVLNEEQQEFLYFSERAYTSNLFIGFGMALVLLGLVFARGRVWMALFEASRHTHDSVQVSVVAESCFGVLRFTVLSAFLCSAMLPLYFWGAGYYICGQPLGRATAAYLTGSWETLVTSISWSCLTLFFAASVTSIPKRTTGPGLASESTPAGGKLVFFWILWLVVVFFLSMPSILFAVAQALPANNTSGLSSRMLHMAHTAAPIMIVGIDMLLASALAKCYSALTGIRTDRLLMSLRLCSAWLLSMLTTLLLHENCLAGWKSFWSVCDSDSPRHQLFNWKIWHESILSTDEMCQLEPSWWHNGRCSRAMIEGLAPLLMKKLLLRTCLQPALLLLAWQLSKLDPERADGSSHLRLFRFGPTTSGCLSPIQQHAMLTTFMETTIFWGPLNPLVSLCVAAATMVNVLLFSKAVTDFRVRLPTDDANSQSTLSRGYLVCSIAASSAFQIWHAFGTGMNGQVLLVLTATAVIAYTWVPLTPVHCTTAIRCLRWLIWRPRVKNEEESIELTYADALEANVDAATSAGIND